MISDGKHFLLLKLHMQCPLLLVQPTRAHHNAQEVTTTAQGRIPQEHLVLKDTAGVMGHPSMIIVPAYVS